MTKEHIKVQFDKVSDTLLNERNSLGFWEGELSSSALSTAVAVVALKMNGNANHQPHIESGLNWLKLNGNSDGGYGDTPESKSNISTSLLCFAALAYCDTELLDTHQTLTKLKNYLNSEHIDMSSDSITGSILNYYGKDYTFSVPILTLLAVSGIIEKENFNKIPALPFEFSILPHKFYQFLNLQVVSYAIPALIAVGITLFKNQSKGNRLRNLVRSKAISPSLRKLEQILPESGGFLEAIPLTAFVNICLNHSGFNNSVVVNKGINFLVNQQRNNGSWPIDTHLSMWVSTLSIKAFGNRIQSKLTTQEITTLREHLLDSRFRETHPFNHAKPGAWGWTHLSGSVPDGDDTAGAILALHEIYEGTEKEQKALLEGVNWLIALQNSDGGIPTFSKGWGKLPFDASCPDITGHALLALTRTLHTLPTELMRPWVKKWDAAAKRMSTYLLKNQKADGSWIPLWFGSQLTKTKENKIYGTSKVSVYLQEALEIGVNERFQDAVAKAVQKSKEFIAAQQNVNGSWGAEKGIPGTLEETALAVSALTGLQYQAQCLKAFRWLEQEYNTNGSTPAPIGLYFATLWYHEKLYPQIFYLEALRRNL
jgi:squalene-hopene/tetraprenyl-beta-curcumene cyclase